MVCRVTWEWIIHKSPYTDAPKTLLWLAAHDGDEAFDLTEWVEIGSRNVGNAAYLGTVGLLLPLGVTVGYVRRGDRKLHAVGSERSIQNADARYGGRTMGTRMISAIRYLLPRTIDDTDLFASGYADHPTFFATLHELYPAIPGIIDMGAWALTLTSEVPDERGSGDYARPASASVEATGFSG